MQSDGLNSTLSPVVYGGIALSINTQYNTILKEAVEGDYYFILVTCILQFIVTNNKHKKMKIPSPLVGL